MCDHLSGLLVYNCFVYYKEPYSCHAGSISMDCKLSVYRPSCPDPPLAHDLLSFGSFELFVSGKAESKPSAASHWACNNCAGQEQVWRMAEEVRTFLLVTSLPSIYNCYFTTLYNCCDSMFQASTACCRRTHQSFVATSIKDEEMKIITLLLPAVSNKLKLLTHLFVLQLYCKTNIAGVKFSCRIKRLGLLCLLQ